MPRCRARIREENGYGDVDVETLLRWEVLFQETVLETLDSPKRAQMSRNYGMAFW